MTKDKKGITLISLAVTIVIMIIIFSVTLNAGMELIDNASKVRIESALYLVKAKADIQMEQFAFDNDIKHLTTWGNNTSRDIDGSYSEGTEPTEFGGKNPGVRFIAGNVTAVRDAAKNRIFAKWPESAASNGGLVIPKTMYPFSKDFTVVNVPRFMFTKMDLQSCYDVGIYSNENNARNAKNKQIVDGRNKYFLVMYDLLNQVVVDVAYSKGYTYENYTAYTLTDIRNIEEKVDID